MSNVLRISDFKGSQKPMENLQTTTQGLVFLHRKMRDLPFYKTDSEAVHLWVHLIMEVNSAPGKVTTEFGEYPVARGQVITGRHTLARDTGITPDRVKYLLNKFEKMGMVTTQTNKKFTVLTVAKYDDYQQFFVPTECQQSANAKPDVPRPSVEVVPTECQQSATNNILNTISLTNVRESASADKKAEKKKPSLSCQQVIDVYHELLPEAQKVRALNDKRKSQIQTFWRKAGVITRQLDGHGFTLEDWKSYLNYVGANCRWMFEERTNQQRGTVWRKKGFDFLLNDNTYLKVREGEHDDR